MDTLIKSIGTVVSRQSDGFLVHSAGEEEVTVSETSEGLICECFISRVTEDGICEHIQAVQQHTFGNISKPPEQMSQARADQYLALLGKLDSVIQQNQDSASIQKDAINDWLEHENEMLENRKHHYIQALDNWLISEDLKSKRLVYGNINRRQQQPLIEILDEQAILQDDRFIRRIPEKLAINKSAIRKHVISTGEELPGITVQLRDPKFNYRIAQPRKDM